MSTETATDRAMERLAANLGQHIRLTAAEQAARVDHRAKARDAFAAAKRRIRWTHTATDMRREVARDALRVALRYRDRA